MIPLVNGISGAIDWGFQKTGIMLPSIGLGGVGGRIMRGDWNSGFLQGAVTGAISYGLLRPVRKVIDKNTGNGPDQINSSARWKLWVLGKILQYGVPAAVTVYLGPRILTALSTALPQPVGSWVAPNPEMEKYNTMVRALIANIAPAAIEHAVSWMRSENKRNQ